MRLLYIVFFFVFCHSSIAQELVKSIPIEGGRSIFTDDLGNVYLIRDDNSLTRYSPAGDSTGNFRTVQNGELRWIDATNPLRILLYYPAFSKIILLDRMLSPKNELNLKKLQLYNPPAVGMSADGKIWVYDFVNARLKKIDDQLNMVQVGNDMRQESQTVPKPSALLEKDGVVYISDALQGIYTFDRFAGYKNKLDIKGISKMQVLGSQLIYCQGDTLQAYDMKTFLQKSMLLPGDNDFIEARIERNRLYYLYVSRLDIYRLESEE